MFPWKKDLTGQQRHKQTSVVNSKKFIIVHHTATPAPSLAWNIKILTGTNPDGSEYKTDNPVSAHALIDYNGDAYKLAQSDWVAWHAGKSNWGSYVGLNFDSIGIEVLWPTNGAFSEEQYKTTTALIAHYMATYKIPASNVLRHKDLTWAGSMKAILYDGKSPTRKPDIDDSFWNKKFKSWDEYRKSIVPKAL